MASFISELDKQLKDHKCRNYFCGNIPVDKVGRVEASIMANNRKRLYLANRTYDLVLVGIQVDNVYIELKLSEHIESNQEALGRISDILSDMFREIKKQLKSDIKQIVRVLRKIKCLNK